MSLLQRLHAALPEAVSGGSDPIHVTLRHSLPPHTNVLLIAARAYNATNCRIDRMQIQVVQYSSQSSLWSFLHPFGDSRKHCFSHLVSCP